ncbi:Sec-independent protein translocase family protein [Glutamicibacter nicotianae]|uniref:twin-arginine translocase TatA/TatE family subunit n=1 Tax=Glutamicibacter nicotianae TaxID=37929 RepID=UPI001CBB92D9|nr:twin-arginine translocase TatA/TatE family subunit [Glutamicibacter nicotianae]
MIKALRDQGGAERIEARRYDVSHVAHSAAKLRTCVICACSDVDLKKEKGITWVAYRDGIWSSLSCWRFCCRRSKASGLARSMGQSLRIFKSEVRQMKDDDPKSETVDGTVNEPNPNEKNNS